jgi:hypothetical protein
MNRLQTVALYLIALTSMADFAVDHLLRMLALRMKNQKYIEAARACHEAQSNKQQLRDEARQFDQKTRFALDRSSESDT